MPDTLAKQEGGGWFHYALLVAFVAGLGFFALSFVLLGIIPGRSLAVLVKDQAPTNMANYTPSEERGRLIYARDGCAYCHSQQVRFVPADVARWGAPTEAWETKYDAPQLWGTRRIGPDLAREGGVRPDDWHLTHLFNPRLTVRDSVMPGYPWLFEGSASNPGQGALDLVAYLQTLGRPRENSGYATAAMTVDPAMPEGETAELIPRENPIATKALMSDDMPPGVSDADNLGQVAKGNKLFAANCASCHGTKADGNSAAAGSLLPKPADLTANRYTPRRVMQVLWNGVVGSAMPAWRDLAVNDLHDLTAYVVSLNANPKKLSTEESALAARGQSVFTANCTGCHGVDGRGDGPAAASMAPRPTNFHIEQPGPARIADVLAHGVRGTSMPGWAGTINEDDRKAVSAYVRSIFETSANFANEAR